jgi:hypothetical protein
MINQQISYPYTPLGFCEPPKFELRKIAMFCSVELNMNKKIKNGGGKEAE